MSWYDLDSNVVRVCTNKARIYSIKQGLSRFEHDLQNDFYTIVVRFQVRSVTTLSRFEHDLQKDFHTIVVRFQVRSSTACYSLVRLNTTFTRLSGHLQGLHTVPSTFVWVRFHTIYIQYWHGRARTCGVDFMCGCIYGFVQSHTVLYSLTRSLTVLYDR